MHQLQYTYKKLEKATKRQIDVKDFLLWLLRSLAV